MITWIKNASIFNSSCSVLVNPVNCDGIMGAGLALQFKNKFPAMFDSYKLQCARGNLCPGKLLIWWNPTGAQSILCFPTKLHWQDSSHISYVRAGLAEFLKMYHRELGIDSIAFPMLGCGLGGLDRGEVREIMNEYLGVLKDLRVEIYSHQKEA